MKDDFFVPENARPERRSEYLSPSGRYKLVITPYGTKPGSWNFTQGLVYDGEKLLTEIRHNYSHMMFVWVEGHANGHDYLVTQEDYQGQSVIELDTGGRKDYLPEEAKKGHGFCWASTEYNAQHQMLIVSGCVWACPYETRFYDFSNPMGGWPQIGEKTYIDSEHKKPEVSADGIITCFETREDPNAVYPEDDDAEYEEQYIVVAHKSFRQNGLSLELVSEWVDEAEKQRRIEWAENQKRWQEEWERFKANDPVFLRLMERIKADGFDDAPYSLSTGQCYDGWHPTEKFDDSRVCKRIAARKTIGGNHKVTMDLDFGRKTAPIKLQVYLDPNKSTTHWYDRTVQGMDQAMDFAKGHL